MTSTDWVNVINAASFVAFFVFLFLGAGSTLARVAYYRAWNYRRPRILTRDAWFVGGFAVSLGSILLVRLLRIVGFDTSGLATNPWWALVTAVPAIVAIVVYVYFELAIIERGKDEVRDEILHPPKPLDDVS